MSCVVQCDWCGKQVKKYVTHKHNFCSRSCFAAFSSKTQNPDGYSSLKCYSGMSINMARINRRLNPTRMTQDVREKLHDAHTGSGEGKTYTKKYGVHEHRVVASEILGRPLLSGEVVHHINGNKRDNRPENLHVFASQAEHARFHAEQRRKEGGDVL